MKIICLGLRQYDFFREKRQILGLRFLSFLLKFNLVTFKKFPWFMVLLMLEFSRSYLSKLSIPLHAIFLHETILLTSCHTSRVYS